MGEYAYDADGNMLCKLGTMDDFRYVTRKECERIAASGKVMDSKGEAASALLDGSILYRFPWPDEDGDRENGRACVQAIGQRSERVMSVPFVMRGVRHDTMALPVKGEGGGYQFNLIIPCPLSPACEDVKNFKTGGEPTPHIAIVGERYKTGGEARTIFRCGYCECPFSMSEAELAGLRAQITTPAGSSGWGSPFWQAVAERLKPNR
jgi:hypothetical protein